MDDYTRKSEAERARMGDDELLDWIAVAREAGDFEHARDCCGMLAFRYEDRIQAKILAKMDPRYAEEVFMEVIASATRSAFDGKYAGQFGAWINTITHRRIVDFYRAQERQPDETLFEEEHEGEEGVWVTHGVLDENYSMLAYREIAEELRLGRKKEFHQLVIKLYGPEELGYHALDAATTCEFVAAKLGEEISEDNVAQIWRRFRLDLKDALERAKRDPGGEGS